MTESRIEDFHIRSALEKAWSLDTAKQWSPENPANGQCNVTSALIHDLFGGDVLRTRFQTVWHYYNQISGKRYDLTDSQFLRSGARLPAPESYDDEMSDRDAAMEVITQREYDALKEALLEKLK